MVIERKAAIVTGAASGLGRAMALGLVGSGIDVVAVDRNAAALAALAPPKIGTPGSILAVPADLAQPDAFDRIVAAALERFGHIDVLVNNAGIGQASVRADQRRNPIRFWEASPRSVEPLPRRECHRADHDVPRGGAHMLRAKQGRIITVTTSLGTMVRAGYLLYGASKAAAESATAIMAADLAGTGVTANVLVPGGVTNTPLVGDDAGDRGKMLQPEIMVPPLLWLVSDAAAGVTARRFMAADWDPLAAGRAGRREGGGAHRLARDRADADRAHLMGPGARVGARGASRDSGSRRVPRCCCPGSNRGGAWIPCSPRS